jgi:hypothetical protein
VTGHPWPGMPRLASMPNAPLHTTSTRPPDGVRGPRCLGGLWRAEPKATAEASRASPLLRGSGQSVGWVERSDTHQPDHHPTAWVSPCSTCAARPILQSKSQLAALPNPSIRARTNAPSAGRVESLRKGLSGMDAARAAMGQGWPFAAGPWSNDGAREPDEVGPDARGKTFCLLLGRLPKVSRRKGGTVSREQHRSGVYTQTSKQPRQ